MINKRSLFLILLFLIFASCGPSLPSKEQVLRDAASQIPFGADKITVEKVLVDKYEKDLAFANVVGDDCMYELKYKKTDRFWKYDSISKPGCAYLADALVETYCNKILACVARINKKNITREDLEKMRPQCMSVVQPLRDVFLELRMRNAWATLVGEKTPLFSEDAKLCTQAINKAACKDMALFANPWGLPECSFLEPKVKSTEKSEDKDSSDVEDKLIATKTTEGYFVGWEVGDYNHAVFKDRNGEEISFFADPSIEETLANLKGKLLGITFEVRKTYIHEAGGPIEIEVLKSVKYGEKVYKP